MKLYLAVDKRGVGRVYHLRDDYVGDTPDSRTIEATPEMVENYSKTLGMRRICLRCRKKNPAEKAETLSLEGPKATWGPSLRPAARRPSMRKES